MMLIEKRIMSQAGIRLRRRPGADAGRRLAEDPVHLFGGERNRRRLSTHRGAGADAVGLNHRRALPGLDSDGSARGVGVHHLVVLDHLVGRQPGPPPRPIGLAGRDALGSGHDAHRPAPSAAGAACCGSMA